jgi:hypothetical protein
MPEFSPEGWSFRIPISDFQLQLDYRLNRAFALLPAASPLWVWWAQERWNGYQSETNPYHAVLRRMGFVDLTNVLFLEVSERPLALALSYLTNRWGRSGESLCILAEALPDLMLYFPTSPVSVFAFCRGQTVHDRAVEALVQANVPAYGPHIAEPLAEPTYEGFTHGEKLIQVDRETGRIVGPGSEESVILPFLIQKHRFFEKTAAPIALLLARTVPGYGRLPFLRWTHTTGGIYGQAPFHRRARRPLPRLHLGRREPR